MMEPLAEEAMGKEKSPNERVASLPSWKKAGIPALYRLIERGYIRFSSMSYTSNQT